MRVESLFRVPNYCIARVFIHKREFDVALGLLKTVGSRGVH
jgi:hypothetical protein